MNAKIIASLAFTSMFSLSTLLNPAYAEEQEKALNFGIISTESQQNLKPQWTPFLQDMEKKLGVKVNAFFAPDYAGIIQGMRFNKVDIAWYGNLSAMEAVDRANGQVFAQTVAADGSPGYWSVLIVNKDSLINNLNDLLAKRKDLTFGNGDPNSTSGFLVPGYYVFAKNNISASDFKRTVNAGHETNALAVANKQVDVATNNTENLDKLKTSAPEKLKELKVIWKSPLIPGDPIVWRKNLSETTKDKIYDFFMNYGKTPEEKAVLERLGWAPFRASSDLQLVPIRQLALFKEMQSVKDNKGLIAIFVNGDKDQKVARVSKKYELSESQAADLMKKKDRARKMYHNINCDSKWGDSRNYELVINSSKLGVDKSVQMLIQYIDARVANR